MQPRTRLRKTVFIALPLIIVAFVVIFVAVVGAVVGGGGEGADPARVLVEKGRVSTDGMATGGAGDTSMLMPETAVAPNESGSGELGYGPSVLDPARYLVRTGDMTIVVDEGGVPGAAGRVSSIAAGFNGYVTNSQITIPRDGQRPYAIDHGQGAVAQLRSGDRPLQRARSGRFTQHGHRRRDRPVSSTSRRACTTTAPSSAGCSGSSPRRRRSARRSPSSRSIDATPTPGRGTLVTAQGDAQPGRLRHAVGRRHRTSSGHHRRR